MPLRVTATTLRASFFGLISLSLFSSTIAFRVVNQSRAQESSTEILTKIFEWKLVEGNLQCFAFSPKGELLAAGFSSGVVRTWDLTSGKEFPALVAPRGTIASLAFSQDGKLLVTGNLGMVDSTVRIWDVSSRKELATLAGPRFNSTVSVVFSADGELLAAAGSCGQTGGGFTAYTVKAWKVSGWKQVFQCDGFNGRGMVPFLADNKTLAVPRPNGMIGLWNVTSGKKVREFQALGDRVCGLALQHKVLVVPSGFQLSGMSPEQWPDIATRERVNPNTILLYDTETGKEQGSFDLGAPPELVTSSADGKMLLAGAHEKPEVRQNFVLKWWEVPSGKKLGEFRGLHAAALALSPDGSKLAVGRGSDLSLWRRERR
jgi:WD40 repeat protein